MAANASMEKTAPALADVVDTAHLGRYTMGDVKLERELLAMFSRQLEEIVSALATTEDGGEWKLLAHTLKGAAMAVGAFPLAGTAKALEEAGPDAPGALRDELARRAAAYQAAWRRWDAAA